MLKSSISGPESHRGALEFPATCSYPVEHGVQRDIFVLPLVDLQRPSVGVQSLPLGAMAGLARMLVRGDKALDQFVRQTLADVRGVWFNIFHPAPITLIAVDHTFVPKHGELRHRWVGGTSVDCRVSGQIVTR
jgi:hypothetical protein